VGNPATLHRTTSKIKIKEDIKWEEIAGQPCRELEVLARLGENKGRTEEIKELVLKLQDRLSRVSRP